MIVKVFYLRLLKKGVVTLFSLPIDQVQSGMKLAKPVFNMSGTLLLDKDNILDGKAINALTNAGAKRLWVTDEGSRFLKEQGPQKVYQDILHVMEGVKEKVILGRTFDINAVNEISQILAEQIIENEMPFAEMVRMKVSDNSLLEHMIDVAILSIVLGKSMGMDKLDLRYLGFAALVHDIGELLIPREILYKPTPLTDSEMKLIRKHPQFGYDILKNIDGINKHALNVTLQHHERIDGSGYPRGVKGNAIANFSKLVAIVDIYSAIIREKEYRPRMPIYEAGELLWAQAGVTLDRNLTLTFLYNVVAFPLRSTVKLNNGMVAQIIAGNSDFPMRPVVYTDGEMYDLAENPTIFITELIAYDYD